jgi:hypothetical protein
VNWADVARRLDNAVCVDLALENGGDAATAPAPSRLRRVGR